MVSFAPAQQVEGLTRQPLPYGLFSVLTPRTSADPHWQNGVVWEALGCAPASGFGQADCDPEEEVTGLPRYFREDGTLLEGTATSFTIYGSAQCSPVGNSIDAVAQKATEHLLAREEARAEQALWTGDLGNEGFAADAVSVGASQSLLRAVAALDQWLAQNYGSVGVLHMTREAALLGVAKGSLTVSGNRLTTRLGTPVVAGAGYPGTGPTGQAPAAGSTYVYATPALLGYRSDVEAVPDTATTGFNHRSNDLKAVAERTYVIGIDPCGSAYAVAELPED